MRALAFALALLAAPAAVPASASAAEPYRAAYDVFVGGFRLAEVSLEVLPDSDGWRARADIATRGLAAFFAPAAGSAEAGGPILAGGPEPGWFAASGDFDGLMQRVEIRHANGSPPVIEADPPLRIRPYEPPPETLRGALDPLTAAVAALTPRPVGAICDRRFAVFDSRRRFDLALGPAEREGDFLRCEGRYIRVSGFKAKHMRLPDAPFTLYWRESGGAAEFVKAVAPTPFGYAVAHRR